ncbi:hypothetical protein CTI12_AA355330 [Artemisia annua]|uniref:Uncharacterized protein n=1 Tax=Artemisia annua TaxID=35608 RepID=A0A2U1MQ15_ARTAN|nr:hypothetical protein CTI12_AA355330 [Artemisia annua]
MTPSHKDLEHLMSLMLHTFITKELFGLFDGITMGIDLINGWNDNGYDCLKNNVWCTCSISQHFPPFIPPLLHLRCFVGDPVPMKKSSFFAASIAAVSATTAVTGSTINIQTSHQEHGEPSKRDEKNCCSEKFAPRFDGLRFIETLVTAHR